MRRLRRSFLIRRKAIGLVLFCFVIGCGVPEWSTDPAFHGTRPYSTLEGTTVRVKPVDATFSIPEDWIVPQERKNLFLSSEEMDRLDNNPAYGIKFDEEYGSVLDSIVPFENCAAHIGSIGWNAGTTNNNLQFRFCMTSLDPDRFSERVVSRGLRKAKSLFEEADLVTINHEGWQKYRFDIVDAPTHAITITTIDLYFRRCNGTAVVFAFVRSSAYSDTVEAILRSFQASPSMLPCEMA